MNPPPKPVFDRAEVLDNLGGDARLLKQIAAIFIADWPAREAQLRQALADGAAEPLRVAAHAIKGAVGNFAAERAFAAARRLEFACKAGDLSQAPALAAAVLEQVDDLLAALHAELE